MRRSGHSVAQGPRVSIAEAETHNPSLLPGSVLFVMSHCQCRFW